MTIVLNALGKVETSEQIFTLIPDGDILSTPCTRRSAGRQVFIVLEAPISGKLELKEKK